MLRAALHLASHLVVPPLVARAWWPTRWKVAATVMVATIAVDLDHLLATPIYDPNRCSIGVHPLHTWPAILVYLALCLPPRTRWLGVGLVLHMALDAGDCALMRLG